MKVLMVTREYPPFIVGGVATHTYQLVRYLRKFGVDVMVLSFGDPKLSTDNEIFIEPQSSVIEEARGGTKLYKDLLLVKDIEKITSYARKLLLKESKIDIVHVQEPYIGGLITFNRKVTTIHDTGIGEVKSILGYSNLSNSQILKKLLFYLTLGYFMEYASILTSKVIIAPSYTCKRELVYWYKVDPSRIVVIHNGVEKPLDIPSRDEARRILEVPRDRVIILTVGRHIPQKRIDLLIKAIHKLDSNTRESIYVIIVGYGPETPYLRRLVDKFKLTDVVEFTGYVPYEKIWLYYSASDIFVLTSDKESAPMTLIEAASTGSVIVTSRTGDYALIMRNRVDGMIFEPGDVDALARILEELVLDKNLRYRLAENAKLFASKFTAEKMAWKTLGVYEKLVRGQV